MATTTDEPSAVVTVDISTATAPAVVVKHELRTYIEVGDKAVLVHAHLAQSCMRPRQSLQRKKRVGSTPAKSTSGAVTARIDMGTSTDPVAHAKAATYGSAPRAWPKPAQLADKPPEALLPYLSQPAPLPFRRCHGQAATKS